MEQLIGDISKSLGRPKWRNDRINKLYTIRGEEITDPSQIFNECDVFVAVPYGGRIQGEEMSLIIEGTGINWLPLEQRNLFKSIVTVVLFK